MSENVPAWLQEYVAVARRTPRDKVESVEIVAQTNGVPPAPDDNLPTGVVAVWNGKVMKYRARTSGPDRRWLGTFDTPGQAAKAIREEKK